jgi:hypothetical protein
MQISGFSGTNVIPGAAEWYSGSKAGATGTKCASPVEVNVVIANLERKSNGFSVTS